MTLAPDRDLDNLKFHFPMQKQFHRVYMVTKKDVKQDTCKNLSGRQVKAEAGVSVLGPRCL